MNETEAPEKPETILDIEHDGNGMFVIKGLSEKAAVIGLPLKDAVRACEESGHKFRFTSMPRSMRRGIKKRSGVMIRVGVIYTPAIRKEANQ